MPATGGERLPCLAGAEWLARPQTQAVLRAIEAGGYPARAVGGVVRNALLGLPVADVDIATPAPPEKVMQLATAAGLKAVPTGLEHGTVTIIADRTPFEVTTLRKDIETFGRHARVAFTDDWAADARRRDFTINALYCDRHGTVYDPVGGYPDLVNRRVRFIGDPVQRIREDYLRILRFFRFHALYGTGDFDQSGLEACIAEREGLSRLSAERIREEMLRLIVAPGALQAIETINAAGIADIVLGRRGNIELLSRVIDIEAALGRSPDALLRLAALSCETPEDADALASRWKLSNDQRAQLEAAMFTDPALDPVADLREAKACRFELSADSFERAYIMAWARSGADPRDHSWLSRFQEIQRWRVPEVPFKGADVVALGIPPGPDVGKVLKQFRDWWIDADFPENSEMLQEKLLAFAGPFMR